jgi:uncharacterized HhH-GPD family protein
MRMVALRVPAGLPGRRMPRLSVDIAIVLYPVAVEPRGTAGATRYDARMTDRLHLTGDDEADRLLVSEPMALLIGFALDQQVPVQKAFSGPKVLLERLGTLDARELATIDEARLQAAAKGPPAIHRFPSAMAKRVRELAAFVAETYDGDAARIWTDASDGRDLQRRLAALPGFGTMKVASLTAVLARRLGVRPPGIDDVLPSHPTLGDVDSPAALAEYQSTKRAAKAARREGGA